MLPNFFYCDLWTLKYPYSIETAAKWLYPDLFNDMDIEAERQQMLKKLYDR